MTLEEMTEQRDALLTARYRGVRTVEIYGQMTYAPTVHNYVGNGPHAR
jgi:hypothetical protein